MTVKAKHLLLAASTLAAIPAGPAFAQDSLGLGGNDIVVTARRVEERLQDVPISITVLSNETLANNNITSAKDITTYTPGLVAQGRYGNDAVAFTIRGFSQEQRTTATVGTYFGDVVQPRGSGASQGGDGAGPGQLFDLENVQVLKGPQGTLQGRNSTGGAVLLVPKKPTDRFEGYVEGSLGNYDLRRVQAVVNVPVMDTLRLRFGVDRNKRDGYLKNVGNLGDGPHGADMANTNYWAARFSAVADLSPDVENHTIISYVNSKTAPSIPKIIKAYGAIAPGTGFPFGNPCSLTARSLQCDQVAREAGAGGWAVSNSLADTASVLKQWQVINTTKWQVNDNLVIKNIFSYAEHRSANNMDLFGGYWLADGTPFGTERPDQVLSFAYTHAEAAKGYSNAQSTLVEELQFQGNTSDGRFVWQAGFYFENNDPLGFSGVQTSVFTPCTDLNTYDCRRTGSGPGIAGQGNFSISQTRFRDRAVYGQASYDITEKLKFTAGLRYTWDEMVSRVHNLTWRLRPSFIPPEGLTFICANATAPGAGEIFLPGQERSACGQTLRQKTEAPTWLLGLDFKPMDDWLLYAKWSRGYRQGGITIFGADPIQPYGEEKVDTYEVGSKLSWRGAIPGNFNISAFYNDFRDQQLQAGVSCDPALPGYIGPC
ncbi:MAG: TonB-dependent receptor, partial [Novosphingobium sp.]